MGKQLAEGEGEKEKELEKVRDMVQHDRGVASLINLTMGQIRKNSMRVSTRWRVK